MPFRRTAAALSPFLFAVCFSSPARAQQPTAPQPYQPLPPQQQQPPPQTYPPPQQQPLPPPQAYPPPQQQLPPPQAYPPPQQQLPPPQAYPPQQQLPPPQGYPPPPQQQLPPPQGYPPPQQQQLPPPQGYPQTYPPQQQPAPQGYPPPQPYPPAQQLPPPGYVQPPPPGYVPPQPPPLAPAAAPSGKRDDAEMLLLYGTSAAWGIGTGAWADILANTSDPGVAFIAPVLLGAAAPIGMYFLDRYDNFDRGVPASISTGLTLGAIEGVAISGTAWQLGGNNATHSSWVGWSSLTWVISTAGGVGGYFFGEYVRPDPRTLSFIVSGAGWGSISGVFIGAGAITNGAWEYTNVDPVTSAQSSNMPTAFGDGASVGGLIGYNAGILATGIASIAGWVPSYRTQNAMWGGYVAGSLAGSLVYLGYIGQPDAHHGMIANGLAGLAGAGIAAAITANLKDTAKAWVPPFQIGISPPPSGSGAAVAAYGSW